MKIIKIITLLFLAAISTMAFATANVADKTYCFGEPIEEAFGDTILCLNIDSSAFMVLNKVMIKTFAVHGLIYSRIGDTVSFSGSIVSDINENNEPIYTIHYTTTLLQHTQPNLKSVVPYYIVSGAMDIIQSKLEIIAPANDRFNPAYSVGNSDRQNVMMNASLIPGDCTNKPWLCWDLDSGFINRMVVRLDPNDLPFIPHGY